jgi:hypothetical protein
MSKPTTSEAIWNAEQVQTQVDAMLAAYQRAEDAKNSTVRYNREQLMQALRDHVTRHTEGWSDIEREAWITFTRFDLHGTQFYANSVFPECRDEGIYEVSSAEDATEMSFQLSSWKGNYDGHTATATFHAPPDTNRHIYAQRLMSVEPRAFRGRAWTRGGFTGWNWYDLPEAAIAQN